MNIELIDIWCIKTPIFTRFNIDKIIKILKVKLKVIFKNKSYESLILDKNRYI